MKASNEISSRTARPADPHATGDSSSSTAKSFTLDGPSLVLDERVHAYRRDIADIALAGQLFAPHYARPLNRACGAHATYVRSARTDEGDAISELLPGEEFAVLEYASGWAWGYCRADHYVGYVEAIALVDPMPTTHIVCAAAAPIHAEPDRRSPPLAMLPMGSRLAGEEHPGYLATDSGYVCASDLRPVRVFESDPVRAAERLIGAPYLAGGRSQRGIDCSGLVQVSLCLSGIPAPRDSDQQRSLGHALADGAALKRGDLVAFDGHVGLMVDADRLIHASQSAGKVAVEALGAVAARSAIVERRRLSR